jgi:hypothetical protein
LMYLYPVVFLLLRACEAGFLLLQFIILDLILFICYAEVFPECLWQVSISEISSWVSPSTAANEVRSFITQGFYEVRSF